MFRNKTPLIKNVLQALQILSAKEDCSKIELKQYYRRKAKQTHPDKGGSTQLFEFVKQSYDYLLTNGTNITRSEICFDPELIKQQADKMRKRQEERMKSKIGDFTVSVNGKHTTRVRNIHWTRVTFNYTG